MYNSHPVLEKTKIISSLNKKSGMKGTLNKSLLEKIQFDGINPEDVDFLKRPNCENLYQVAAKFSDGIVLEDKYKNTSILDSLTKEGTPILNAEEHAEYYGFYQNFLSEELV